MPQSMRKKQARDMAEKLFAGRFKRMVIDSRIVKKGDVFVALQGSTCHGNTFVSAALKKGAALVIVDSAKEHSKNNKTLVLSRPEKFMAEVAREIVRLSDATFIAVTGSNGKTTTKDLIACALGSGGKVLKTEGNFNNHLGVPLTLSRLKQAHRFAIIEMGTNAPGEIEFLTRIVRPHLSVLTSVNPAHLEGFGSVAGVAEEKNCIFTHMRAPGTCIAGIEVLKHAVIKKTLNNRSTITYGYDKGDIQAREIQLQAQQSKWKCEKQTFSLRTPASHNVYNAGAAIAICKSMGVEMRIIAKRLEKWNPEAHRMNMLSWKKRKIIDDCYNANPVSVVSAAKTALSLKRRKSQRVIALMGDMKELGKKTLMHHRKVGKEMANMGVDMLVTLGEHTKSALLTFDKEGGAYSKHCSDIGDMANFLEEFSRPHDIILIKGARSMKMERVLRKISV